MIAVLDNIAKGFGAQEVIANVTARIEDRDRIGLIGNNGAGKSTLLNILYGILDPDAGSIAKGSDKQFGFLRQDSGLVDGRSIAQEMRSVFAHLDEMESTMRQDEKSMTSLDPDSADYHEVSARYASMQGQYELAEGYQIGAKIATVLNGMGFKDTDWATIIDVLSGGERTRLAICKLLLEEPSLLILDEPTNHLDFPTLVWLEDYLIAYRGALLIVSHDRFFLDKICTNIWEIENHKMETYKGNYTKYLAQKEERLDYRWKQYRKQQEEIADLKDFIAKNMVRASTTKRAQSRQNKLDRMDILSPPKLPPKPPSLNFQKRRDPVSDVLILDDIALSVGEDGDRKQLFDSLDMHIKRGEKIALVGHNGIGKSSLLKAVLNKLPIDNGDIYWGRNTDIAYFEQGEGEMDKHKTVMSELWDDFPREIEHSIRSVLGHAGLRGDEVFKQVKNLSGGERARLKFAKLMLQHSNVILMDEPTNHLDLATKEVLDRALEKYDGTLLVVSHDRYLLNKFPDKIIEMHEHGVDIYPGRYDDYAEKKKKDQPPAEQAPIPDQKPKADQSQKPTGYRTKDQRRESVERRQRLAIVEKDIESLEQEVEILEYEITLPDVMSDYIELEEKCSRIEECKNLLDIALEEWTNLSSDD